MTKLLVREEHLDLQTKRPSGQLRFRCKDTGRSLTEVLIWV
jgi:hypothetical protein